MIRRRDNTTLSSFLRSTIAAQIHLLGLILAMGALIQLLTLNWNGPKAQLISCSVYGLTAMLVFLVSATYHFLYDGFHISTHLEKWFENLDHFAIYLFIAGTYTPFTMNSITSKWKLTLLVLVWSITGVGIVYTHFRPRLPLWAQSRFLYTGIFVLLGMTAFLRANEVSQNLKSETYRYLMIGGSCYTLGALGYALKKPKLYPGIFGYHELWHLAVLLGFVFHYLMILSFYR